jgi:hypothetical protein
MSADTAYEFCSVYWMLTTNPLSSLPSNLNLCCWGTVPVYETLYLNPYPVFTMDANLVLLCYPPYNVKPLSEKELRIL